MCVPRLFGFALLESVFCPRACVGSGGGGVGEGAVFLLVILALSVVVAVVVYSVVCIVVAGVVVNAFVVVTILTADSTIVAKGRQPSTTLCFFSLFPGSYSTLENRARQKASPPPTLLYAHCSCRMFDFLHRVDRSDIL